MEGGAGKGLECPKIMDGKASNGKGLKKAIPSCCLKAKASAPENDAKCHSTVVSGWFSEPQSCSGHYQFLFLLYCFLIDIFYRVFLGSRFYISMSIGVNGSFFYFLSSLSFLFQIKLAIWCISTTRCGLVYIILL